MKRICSCFALALGLPLGALGAQETPALAPGVRVRVTAPDGWRDVGPGSLEAIDSATIVVRRANGTTVAFPRERGTQLEVSWGPGACSGGARRGGCIALGFLGGAACERDDGGFPARARDAALGQRGPWRMQRRTSGWLRRPWLPRRGGARRTRPCRLQRDLSPPGMRVVCRHGARRGGPGHDRRCGCRGRALEDSRAPSAD